MTPNHLFGRYRELQRYAGWTDDDARRVAALGPLLAESIAALVDDFYEEIDRHPDARKVITGGGEQVERLKGTLLQWLRELLSGHYDEAYVARRWRVGWRHVEIGLDQVFTNVALSRLRAGLLGALDGVWAGSSQEFRATSRSLNKLLDLDLAIIEDAYQAEHLARQLKHAREQALQAARLAGIGQMMAGLAHESGNALARSQACLEMLALEVQDRPEALDLIQRIQKAQDHLRQLYEEVRSYAAPVRLERETWDVRAVWRQAWANLAVQRQGRDAELREETAGVDPCCAVDHFRLEQVFRNMFENSLAACRDPVRLTAACSGADLGDRPALQVVVRDNGPGLSAEQRQRIFDPFYTTKTKGTGLGMAIAKRIVEAHGGLIAVGDGAGPGAEIHIILPRDVP
jgi:signal transduction histidine kinase